MLNDGLLDRALSAYARAPEHPGKLRLFDLAIRVLGRHRVVARNDFGDMELDPTDFVQREILLRGSYEPKTVALLRGLLRPGDTFVDIGAHVGQFALVAAAIVGERGRVLAIEPSPEICASLLRNRMRTRPRARFDIVCVALANDERVTSFGMHSAGNLGSTRMVDPAHADAVFCLTMPYSKLADALEIGAVRVAKIDVEGAELLVLRGFAGLDRSRWPDHILFEFIPDAFDYFASPQELIAFVRDSGYLLRDVEARPYVEGNELPEYNLWASKAELAD